MKTVIFVCHGNICRSPAAEWIMKHKLITYGLDNQFEVFSRATSLEEIGNDIYPPMKRALYNSEIPFYQHKAKRITQEDYERADYIFYMDNSNLHYLNRLIVDSKHIFYSITKYTKDLTFIDDPWYSGDFEKTIEEIEQCINDIIKNIR